MYACSCLTCFVRKGDRISNTFKILLSKSKFCYPYHIHHFSFAATNITVESEAYLTANSGGYAPGSGPGAGLGHDTGSSGGSHGGTGGQGSSATYAGQAYDSVHTPRIFGSGGGTNRTVSTGYGGGAIYMQASNYIEIDGTVRANGGTASEIGVGGGAGGSVFLEAQDFLGMENILRVIGKCTSFIK